MLDEQDHVAPSLYLIFDTPARSTRLHRRLALLREFPSLPLFGEPVASVAAYTSKYAVTVSLLQKDLPPNVHLLSLVAQEGAAATVLRLQHVYELGEDPQLSQPVAVDLAALFQGFTATQPVETTLTANMPISATRRAVWRTEGTPEVVASETVDDGDTVTLHARDLRTFLTLLK